MSDSQYKLYMIKYTIMHDLALCIPFQLPMIFFWSSAAQGDGVGGGGRQVVGSGGGQDGIAVRVQDMAWSV